MLSQLTIGPLALLLGAKPAAAGGLPSPTNQDDMEARKMAREEMLKAAIHRNLDALDDGTEVMLKLSLPSIDNFYADLIDHPKVLKVVALSGGYSRDESNEILTRQNGMIASFSRALAEGLSAKQTDDEFNTTLDATIASIAAASAT